MVSLQPEVLITIKTRLICQRMGAIASAASPSTPPASAPCDPGCGGNTLAAFGAANQTFGNIKATWENPSVRPFVGPSVRPSLIDHPSIRPSLHPSTYSSHNGMFGPPQPITFWSFSGNCYVLLQRIRRQLLFIIQQSVVPGRLRCEL